MNNASLTPREREVLTLIAQGMKDTQIAGALCISVKSIKQHTRSIYRKLGLSQRDCTPRVRAAVYAIQAGNEPAGSE